jgi:hypothetical protein
MLPTGACRCRGRPVAPRGERAPQDTGPREGLQVRAVLEPAPADQLEFVDSGPSPDGRRIRTALHDLASCPCAELPTFGSVVSSEVYNCFPRTPASLGG